MRKDVASALRCVEALPGGDGLRAEFVFDPALAVFRGHFPGDPILPGIFQVEMVRAAVDALPGRRHEIAAIVKAKFSRRIMPGETVLLEARWTDDGSGLLRVKATLSVEGETAATISVTLKNLA